MNKLEFHKEHERIKAASKPHLDRLKEVNTELIAAKKILTEFVEQKSMAMQEFLGCRECEFAVEEALGHRACCDMPEGHPSHSTDSAAAFDENTNDEFPGCRDRKIGKPHSEPGDPLLELLKAIKGRE